MAPAPRRPRGPRRPSPLRAHWAAEARSIRTSLSALAVGLMATLAAGLVLAASGQRIAGVPGLLALIPAAIGMRGSVFGALGSRVATAILTGEFRPGLDPGSFLGRQLRAVAILSVTTATQAGLLAWAVSALLGLTTVPLLALVAVALIGGMLSSVVLAAVVVGVARLSRARGWSMDDVGAPTITAAGDLVTLPSLLLASMVLSVPGLATAVGVAGVTVGAVLAVTGTRSRDAAVRRIVRESLAVLTVAVSIDVAAGVAIETRIDSVFSSAAVLVLLPAFLANCGSLGGILSSRLASRLHLGSLVARRLPDRAALLDLSITGVVGIAAFLGVGAVGWLAAVLVPAVDPLPLGATIAVVLVAGALALPVLALVAYVAASVSFRHDLDPDNHGIPVVTATMDLVGVLCLIVAVTVLQVGG